LIFIPVRINGGSPSLFELDSSAEKTSIEPARARELGLAVTPAQTISRAELIVPGLRLGLGDLPVIARKNFAETTGQPAHGVLGRDFFDHAVVVVDYIRQTVQVLDPTTYKYDGQGKPFPVTGGASSALIRAKGNISGRKSFDGDFEINTALDSAIVFYQSYMDSKKISAAHFKAVSASYPELDEGSQIQVGRIKDFQIGAYIVEEPVALFSQANSKSPANAKVAGEIGGDFLRRFSVVFDLPHQRVFLDPNLQVNHTAQEDMSGLSILAKGASLKTFEIVQVRPGTPGSDAGLKAGDVIAGVDEEAAADLTLSAIRELFRQVGHEYKLLIDRHGQSLPITIKMRRLV
jgi:PDZ domain